MADGIYANIIMFDILFPDEEEFFEWQDYLNNYNPALNVTSKDENEQIKVMEKVIDKKKNLSSLQNLSKACL